MRPSRAMAMLGPADKPPAYVDLESMNSRYGTGLSHMTERMCLVFVILGSALLLPTLCFAETVYKCIDAQGHIAYQGFACANNTTQHEIAIEPPPPPGQAPDYGISSNGKSRAGTAPSRSARTNGRGRVRGSSAGNSAIESWECRVGNGEVFYQHGPCPTAIAADAVSTGGKRRKSSGTGLTPVSGRPMARADACKRIHAASASDRKGHARDEDVSTYERNLGHDPCR